jgi:DNA-binding transcriptional MocR family regulator
MAMVNGLQAFDSLRAGGSRDGPRQHGLQGLMTTLSSAVPSQEGLSQYLSHGGYNKHLRRLRHALAMQQAVALKAVTRYFPKGTRVTRPEGGYFLWLELPASVDALQLLYFRVSAYASRAATCAFRRSAAPRRFRFTSRFARWTLSRSTCSLARFRCA